MYIYIHMCIYIYSCIDVFLHLVVFIVSVSVVRIMWTCRLPRLMCVCMCLKGALCA